MSADIIIVYKILCSWGRPKTYADLSCDYKNITGAWHSPHSWDIPLNELNILLLKRDLAPIGALVVSPSTNEPKLSFWSGKTGSLVLLNNPLQRRLKWKAIVDEVLLYPWPSQLMID